MAELVPPTSLDSANLAAGTYQDSFGGSAWEFVYRFVQWAANIEVECGTGSCASRFLTNSDFVDGRNLLRKIITTQYVIFRLVCLGLHNFVLELGGTPPSWIETYSERSQYGSNTAKASNDWADRAHADYVKHIDHTASSTADYQRFSTAMNELAAAMETERYLFDELWTYFTAEFGYESSTTLLEKLEADYESANQYEA